MTSLEFKYILYGGKGTFMDPHLTHIVGHPHSRSWKISSFLVDIYQYSEDIYRRLHLVKRVIYS